MKHIVYTSMIDPEHNLYLPIAPSHAATEKALQASGVSHTVLRNSWYTDQLADALQHGAETGQWITAAHLGQAYAIHNC